jgi:hypothetical protein
MVQATVTSSDLRHIVAEGTGLEPGLEPATCRNVGDGLQSNGHLVWEPECLGSRDLSLCELVELCVLSP